MKAVRYLGKEMIGLEEIGRPSIGEDEVLIKIVYCGICGSDMSIYFGKHPRAKAPLVLGHEFSGEIAELPAGYRGTFSVGDNVTVNPLLSCHKCTPCITGNSHVCKTLGLTGIDADGGFAEFVKVHIDQLVKLPSDMSVELGAIVEPVAVAVHAVRRSALKVGDVVLIIGGGPIGFLISLVARAAGARKIIVIEPSDFRRQLLSNLGFETMAEAIQGKIFSLTESDGADIVFEVAGVAEAMDAAVKYCKIRGQIVNVSVFKQPTPVDLMRVNFAELDIVGTRVYAKEDFVTAVDLIAKIPEIAGVITHKLPLARAQEGIDLMKQGSYNQKVLLFP